MGNKNSTPTTSSQALAGKHGDLWDACWDGNKNAVQMLIKQGANVDSIDEYYGASCLMIACAFGHMDTARMLINNGADVNAVSTAGQEEDEEACEYRTALHIACTFPNNASAMAELLINCGANPAMVDAKNRTPIDMARALKPALVPMLEESCAVISRKMDFLDVTEETSRWRRRSSLVFTHSQVRVEIVPVMTDPGVNYGAYSHELVWYRGDKYIGMHPLKESTVHVEECAAEEKAPERFNIVLVNAADEATKPVTFSVESEKGAIEVSKTFRTLCGTFSSVPPKKLSSRPSATSSRASTASMSSRSSCGGECSKTSAAPPRRKSDVSIQIEFLNRRGGRAPAQTAAGGGSRRYQLSADQFSKYASESNNDRVPAVRRQERTSTVVNYY